MRTRLSDLLNSTMGNPRSRASLPLLGLPIGAGVGNHASSTRAVERRRCCSDVTFNFSVGLEARGPSRLAAIFRGAPARHALNSLFAAPDRAQNPVSLLGLPTVSELFLGVPR